MKTPSASLLTTLFAATTLALPAASQANDAGLTCTTLTDNAARLACFDRVYAAQLPPQRAIETPAEPPKSVDLVKSYEATVAEKQPAVVFAHEPQPEALSAPTDAYTPLAQLFDLEKNHESGILSLREHEEMYILPVWYRSSPNYTPYTPSRGYAVNDIQQNQLRTEAKLQISLKTKVMEDLFRTRADLWVGYTQQSNWQVYNQGSNSAPFRNTDYAPEIFLTQPVKAWLPGDGKLRMLGAGYIHQSNGQSRPLSRSWNRLYLMAGMEWGKLSVMPRLWLRIDPKGKDNDNPDISDYMGYGDVRLAYQFNEKHTLTSTLRYNPFTGRGAVKVGYTFPIRGRLKAYVQGFHGYGESLIDYNHKQTGIGVGIMFNGWDGL